MRLVDKADMQIGFAESARKTVKWYRKLFYHLVDIVLLNSYNLYLVKTGKHPMYRKFCLEVIRGVFENYSQYLPTPKSRRTGRLPSIGDPTRLQGKFSHFVKTLPPTEKKKHAQKQCVVCATSKLKPHKRKETRYSCKICDVPLCLLPCFEDYHTKIEF